MSTPFTLRTDDALGSYTNIRLTDATLRPGESVPAPPHRIIATDQRDDGRLLYVLWWEPIDMPDDDYAGAETFWNGPRRSAPRSPRSSRSCTPTSTRGARMATS